MLTKEQKLQVYRTCLNDYEKYEFRWPGVCIALEHYSRKFFGVFTRPAELSTLYPEFYAQKPPYVINPNFEYWWDHGDDESRIVALKAAILLVESTN